jgi:hypothetical protein
MTYHGRMPIRELGSLLGDLGEVARKGKKLATVSKRAARNFGRLRNDERLALGKRAVGEALMYVADCLTGPDIEVRDR